MDHPLRVKTRTAPGGSVRTEMSQSVPAEETAVKSICSLPIVGPTTVEDAVFYTAVETVGFLGLVSWPTVALIGTGHALHQRARNVLRSGATGEAREGLIEAFEEVA